MPSFAQATTEQLALNDNLCPFTPAKGPSVVWPEFDPSPRQFTDDGMSIEFNHDIPMRDGVRLRADIFRPAATLDASAKIPIILVITPFGKQKPMDIGQIPPSREFDPGLNGVSYSKYMVFEGSDPVLWTRQGFSYVVVDARGSFASEGEKAQLCAKSDGLDGYDVVEYLATLPWSNGRVGMIGASGLGAIQWQVAALRPPHLGGILVQDAFTDMYADVVYKGGVLHRNFLEGIDSLYMPHGNRVGGPKIHLAKLADLHPYRDETWKLYAPDVTEIVCPMYIVSSLADNGIHTPGTIRGYLAASSKVKYLELHP